MCPDGVPERCLSSANIQTDSCRSKSGGELEVCSWVNFLTFCASWVRSEVGELGGLYAPRQAPQRGIGGLRWCFFHPCARPPFPPARDPVRHRKQRSSPTKGDGATCAGALSTSARELGTPHGGTVHPRRHTPTAARYTPRRHTPRRRTGKAVAPGGRAPAL